MLGARDPDLLAVDDIVVTIAPRRRPERQRVCAARRLGDAEGLQAQGAVGDAGKVFRLLFGVAVPQDRSHRVHLGVTGGGVAAVAMDLLEDNRSGREVQPRPAVFLRYHRREIALADERVDEFLRVGAALVEIAPVRPRILRADPRDTVADFRKFSGRIKRLHVTPRSFLWPAGLQVRPRTGNAFCLSSPLPHPMARTHRHSGGPLAVPRGRDLAPKAAPGVNHARNRLNFSKIQAEFLFGLPVSAISPARRVAPHMSPRAARRWHAP